MNVSLYLLKVMYLRLTCVIFVSCWCSWCSLQW